MWKQNIKQDKVAEEKKCKGRRSEENKLKRREIKKDGIEKGD